MNSRLLFDSSIQMQRLFSLIALLILKTSIVHCQESPQKKANLIEENRFYYFEIPSAINGSNLDPSAISNVTSNFTDSKLSFKLGFPSLFKDAPETKNLKNSGFIQPSFKATNGVTTLFKQKSAPLEFGISAGFSKVLKHSYWVYLNKDNSESTNHSSESMNWLNLIGNIEQGNYNLFDPSQSFGNTLTKKSETNASMYLSFNRYFYSTTRKYGWLSCIWSIAAGYAKINNYTSLKSRTLEVGNLIYNSDSTSYNTIVETTSGRIGNFVVYEGMSAFGEFFIPLIRNKTYGGIYFGNRVTSYSLTNSNIINGTTGFYFDLKDKKPDGGKPAKDILNFSATAQFNQLNFTDQTDYMEKNFSVLIQLAVPLRFN